jgi:hypothetical protein
VPDEPAEQATPPHCSEAACCSAVVGGTTVANGIRGSGWVFVELVLISASFGLDWFAAENQPAMRAA